MKRLLVAAAVSCSLGCKTRPGNDVHEPAPMTSVATVTDAGPEPTSATVTARDSSASDSAATGAAVATGRCVRQFPTDTALRAAPEGKPTTISALLRESPAPGIFTVEGFLQAPHHCPPCPSGPNCKPCEETVFLSEARGAYKGPIAEDVDLRVLVPDAMTFTLLARYRMTVEVCREGLSPRSERELRGYRMISP